MRQEAVDPDYLFVDAQREIPKVTVTSLSPAPLEDCNIMQSILERRRGARRLPLADQTIRRKVRKRLANHTYLGR